MKNQIAERCKIVILEFKVVPKSHFGRVSGEIMTVRFTCRENKIRIIGAGYWRKGKLCRTRINRIGKKEDIR